MRSQAVSQVVRAISGKDREELLQTVIAAIVMDRRVGASGQKPAGGAPLATQNPRRGGRR